MSFCQLAKYVIHFRGRKLSWERGGELAWEGGQGEPCFFAQIGKQTWDIFIFHLFSP
jgi:hypothetical protein